MHSKIIYKSLDSNDLQPDSLKQFNRYQETKRVWYRENDQYNIKPDYFVEQWDDAKKNQVISELQNCLKSGGIVTGAIVDGQLIGFANIERELFGVNHDYRELSYIHVSNDFRNLGIGKKLFQLCCISAKEIGTRKLYIAAHPSEETQYFYRSVGCVYAVEINQRILAKEPLDIQLEFILKG